MEQPVQNNEICVVRRSHANHQQVSRKSGIVPHKAVGSNRVSPTIQRANGAIQQYDRYTNSSLYCKNQRGKNILVRSLNYSCKSEVQKAANTTPFILVLSRYPPGPASLVRNSAVSADKYYSIEAPSLRAKLLARVKAVRAHMYTRLAPP